jgi:hypothetical protein
MAYRQEEEQGLHSAQKKRRGYMVCTGYYVLFRRRGVRRRRRRVTITWCATTFRRRRRKEEGLHGVFKRLRRNGHQLKKEAANSSTLTVEKKRGYMVCTGNYVATNTRKQRRAARSSAEKQAVTHRRPTPRKPLYARLDTDCHS